MFYLHASNRTENLIKQLAEVIRADKQPDLFAQEMFLIQSQGMERMVSQAMADEFRSFCNFKYFLPLDFLTFIAGKIGLDCSSVGFARQSLCWRIDGLLREISDEVYSPLSNYIQGSQKELKRYQLSARLAHLFDQYQVMRPEMLQSWENSKTVTDHQAEPWQMVLWTRLMGGLEGEVHRGVVFQQVIDSIKQGGVSEFVLPKRISVIGLHIVPPVYLDFLNCLADYMDIHFLLLSPCQSYWGSSESKRNLLLKNEAHAATPGMDVSVSEHPLLVSLGRQGKDLQNMMLERADIAAEFCSYIDPCENDHGRASVLRCVQSDLLQGILSQKGRELNGDDGSIQIVSCHSKQRELMVLKDYLLRLFHSDSHLDLRDIVVMAPDIQEYGGLIPAFFNDIQHSIADRSLHRRNSTIQAFVAFLQLLGGRFGWSEVMDLLRQTVVHPNFDLTLNEVETLQDWVIGAGIRWGLSGEQRQQSGGADVKETSWEGGLERLLMGYAIDTDCFVDNILPYPELEGRGAQALGGLCEFVKILSQAERQFKNDCGLDHWSERLQLFINQIFGEGAENDLGELRTLVSELSEASFHTHAIGFEVIREWFGNSTSESRSSSGFLRGQLTFCSMLPMRSIPFKVVCLLGLSDGVFPKNDTHDTFDLMGENIRLGDRSPRADDRYQFLEAILAARSHLYISYIGQSIKTNKEIPPSVVVTEFIDVLEHHYKVKDLVVEHPLHPFSTSYFNKSHQKKYSFNTYHCTTAQILNKTPEIPGKWFESELNFEEEIIELRDLFAFFVNPQKFFVRNCLGIHLGGYGALPEETETFAVEGLEKYSIEQEMLSGVATNKLDELNLKLQTRGQWVLGQPGSLMFDKWQDDISSFYDTIALQDSGASTVDLQVDLSIGKYRLRGNLSHCYENGVMIPRYGNLRGKDLVSGWLHNLILHKLGEKRWARVIAKDKIIGFSETPYWPSLERFIEIYEQGCQTPSRFFIEPAYVHLQQQLNPRSRTQPLQAARSNFQYSLESGYEAEWGLLFQGAEVDELVGDVFEELTVDIMHEIWSNIDE